MRYQRLVAGACALLIAGSSPVGWAEDLSRSPAIGMTQEDVLGTKWCDTRDVHQTITATSTQEQWVCYNTYRLRPNGAILRGNHVKAYLYFDGAFLTAIQN
jgi:hypothetical protein